MRRTRSLVGVSRASTPLTQLVQAIAGELGGSGKAAEGTPGLGPKQVSCRVGPSRRTFCVDKLVAAYVQVIRSGIDILCFEM